MFALFYGDDEARIEENAKHWIKKQKRDIHTYDAKILNSSDTQFLTDLSQGETLFGRGAGLLIKNTQNKHKKNIESLLSEAQTDCAFTCGNLEKTSALLKYFQSEKLPIFHTPKLQHKDLNTLVSHMFKEFNPQASLIQDITNRLPLDYQEALSFLKTTHLYAKSQNQLTLKEIQLCLPLTRQGIIFNVCDYMYQRQTQKMITEIFKNPIPLDIGMIRIFLLKNQQYTVFKTLEQEGQKHENIFKSLRPPIPNWKQYEFQNTAKTWSLQQLNFIRDKLFLAEIQIKKGLNPFTAITKSLIDISRIPKN